MDIIHMETDVVESLVSHLRNGTNTMQDKIVRLRKSHTILSSTWLSPGASQFRTDFGNLIKQFDYQIESLQNLAQRLQQELDEWLQIDQRFHQKYPTRVYLINGINYENDNDLKALKKDLQSQYGSDVEIIIVDEHPYDFVNKSIPKADEDKFGIFKPVAQIWNSGRFLGSTVYGAVSVGYEYVTGGADQTDRVYKAIEKDLSSNGLLDDKDVNVVLVGHSGGGAIAANLSEKLERKAHVDVTGVVTLGSPVANLDKASKYAEVFDVNDRDDGPAHLYGIGQFRSDEMRYFLSGALGNLKNNPNLETLGIAVLTPTFDQLFRDSSSNIHRVNLGKDNYRDWMMWRTNAPHGNYFPKDKGGDKQVSKDVIRIIGKASGIKQSRM